MKRIFYLIIVPVLVLAASCERDNETPLIVTVKDATFEIEDNVMIGDTIGLVPATSNQGSVNFAITSQIPEGAFAIGESYGDLTALNAELFNAEESPEMTVTVSVTKEDIVKTSIITINLIEASPCFEVDLSPWIGTLTIETDITTTEVTGTSGECGLLILNGVDPLAQDCIITSEVLIQLVPSINDPNIGTASIPTENFNYLCEPEFGLDLEVVGTYNISSGIITMEYTDVEFDFTGPLTITGTDNTTEGSDEIDNDGDGVLAQNDEDDANPCLPSQNAGYTDFDSTNAIWSNADCDGDGTDNGGEVINGTDPYIFNDDGGSGDCDNVADTSIWDGAIIIEEEIDGESFESQGTGSASCGTLLISGDVLDFGCDETPMLTLTFEPTSDTVTDGTILAQAQDYNCFNDGTIVYEATGTYDESTQTIILNYKVSEEGFEPIEGQLILNPQ